MLDTSVCVSILRGRSVSSALPADETCIVSVITAAELEVGIHRSPHPREHRRAVECFLACFNPRPFEASAVLDYGEIRIDLEKRGMVIGPLDLLIAAHARSLGAAIVTGNVGEFRRVKGLKVVPWK